TQGASLVSLIDPADPEQQTVTAALNPNNTGSAEAQGVLKTYQKLKTSKRIIEKQIIKTKAEMTYLEQLLQQINVAREADIEEIREELREEGYLKKQTQGKRKNKPRMPVPEEYIASDGSLILVGKNYRQNEYVTTKLAHRDEIWLHALDIPGSHVVVRAKD